MNPFESLRYRFQRADPEAIRRTALVGGSALALLIAVFAVIWWTSIRWQPPPSIFDSPVDDSLGYLAIDDFNQLSLEERMQFLADFADRFRGLEQQESATAAAFLAGLNGPMREQMRQNVRTLAKDILLDGAEGYLSTTEEERAAYLDDWMTRWMREAERLARGEERDLTDDERTGRIKDRSRDDILDERERIDIPQMDGEDAVRFLDYWQSDIEVASTPREQGQIIRFLEDLRGHIIKPPGN
jgi:hypothetical protein